MVGKQQHIKIVVILGSVRPDSLTAKVLALVVDELKNYSEVGVEVIDPKTLNLTLPGTKPDLSVAQLQKQVSHATGIILATPEYHGSYSSVIKLIIENLGYPSVIAGKPVALLGVADGQIGAIKAIEHLRSVCSHIGGIVLPGVVSVAGVHKLFDQQGRCLDKKMEHRIRSVATQMIEYIEKHICPRKALEEFVREN